MGRSRRVRAPELVGRAVGSAPGTTSPYKPCGERSSFWTSGRSAASTGLHVIEELRPFEEPSGAALAGGSLVVADTNNHRLAHVGAGGEVRTFEIRGLLSPMPRAADGPVAREIGPVELTPEVEFTATLQIPEGRKLDPSLGPPVRLSISSADLLGIGDLLLTSDELPARTPLSLSDGEGSVSLLLRVGTCDEGPSAVSQLTERCWRVRARRDAEGSPRMNLGVW